MDLKQSKPIHLRCPKCGYDFSYNTNHVEAEIDRLKCEITSIKSQITQYKSEHPRTYRDAWYKRAQSALAVKNAQLQEYKKARKATTAEIQRQVDKIFFQLVSEKLGKDEAVKLMREAEDQLVYYTYDMASQKFTRFEKA